MKIIWNENLSVKIEEIDIQHQKLIRLVNELHEAMSASKGKEVLMGILCALMQYTQTHFAAEERLLAAHRFPGLDEHHAEHEKLLVKVLEIRQKFQDGRITLTIPVMRFVSEWLTHHIVVTDMQYSDFLLSKGEH